MRQCINNLKFEFYYGIKQLIPRHAQIFGRRLWVQKKLNRHIDSWPILENSAALPQNWQGWPEGKKFALAITHDVESSKGIRKCKKLMELDKEYGFRSSFNFVAEDYEVPLKLRNELRDNGFEIGVHGLKHEKNPFISENTFKRQTARINYYLREWNAKGFRTPSMYHDLDMMHHLNIEYDASTFDTDPFEPQPDGLKTIFPMWIHGKNRNQKGYVELPYTLPQDFLLYIIMRETNIDIWKKKLDWIVEKGGMALFIAHPDYMNFDGDESCYDEYPVSFYGQFLSYIKERYEGAYWNALPREVANFCKSNVYSASSESAAVKRTKAPKPIPEERRQKIWIDLDNSPHVPFFKPIIDELTDRGYGLTITARDCSQTCGLADLSNLRYERIGRHYGKHKILKVAGTFYRSALLMNAIAGMQKPFLAVSHGSRAQLLAAKMLRIPSLVLMDYEYAKGLICPTWRMMPEVLSQSDMQYDTKSVIYYPGIKEDVYVPSFQPDPAIVQEFGIEVSELLVTIRPPATEAHYHNPESEILFKAIVNFIGAQQNARMVILPRNETTQTAWIRNTWPQWCNTQKIIIPDHVIDGLNLIYHSDLVVSGGGTMNREAAALGVPVYSIFRGKIGAVDRYLSESGRLTLLEQVEDIEKKLILNKRQKVLSKDSSSQSTLQCIVKTIEEIADRSTE